MEIASHVPFIVSVRSGLLDLAVKTGVDMFVIYDSDEGRALYNLQKWQCGGKIKELTFQEFLEDGRFERIDDFMQNIRG